MRRSVALPLAAAAFAAAALPASATAASWSTPHAVGSTGRMSQPVVAADVRGRLAIGFVRQIRGDNRAEVRSGTTRSGLRGPSIVLDRSSHFVDSVAVGLPASGADLVTAWRRVENRALRLHAATIAGGRTVRTQALTSDGTESAYSPSFVAGAGGTLELVWSRRTSEAGAPLAGTAFGAPFALPAPGVGAEPQVAIDADGTTVVVWVDSASGRAMAAQAPAGGAFGPPQVLSASGRARAPQLAISTTGTAVAAWLQSNGAGNSVQVATRPRGGSFGAPVQVAEPDQRAFAPRLAATGAGEVLLAWVNSNVATGFGGGPGVVRVQRLGADGTAVGPRLRVTPNGVRTTQPAIVSDGSSAAVVAWTVFRSRTGGPIQARRLSPGGIAGAVADRDARAGGLRLRPGARRRGGPRGRRLAAGRRRALQRLSLRRRRAEPAQAVLRGEHAGDGPVVGLDRDRLVADLVVEDDRHDRRPGALERAVVGAAPLAEAPAGGVDRERRREDELGG